MKKLLLSLAAAATLSFASYAETATFDCSTLGDENLNPLSTAVTVGKVTLSFDKAAGSSAPAYYASGKDIRMYAKNAMAVAAEEGYKVEKLVFTYTAGWTQIGKVTASLGTATQDETGLTWTGNASAFTFTVSEKAELGADPSKAGQFRFTSVEVTYSAGEGETDPDVPSTPENPGGDSGETGSSVVLDNWTAYTWTGGAEGWTADVKGYTITTAKGSSTTDMVQPDSYSIRVYQGATITVTAPAGVEFDKVVVGLDSYTKDYSGAAEGWTSTKGDENNLQFTMTSTTGHNSITFTGGADKQLRIKSITIYTGEGTEPGPDDPVTPPTPTETITVAEALAYITSGNIPAGKVQVKGIISAIDEISAQYGNATFTIKDALADANGLVIFRCKWLNGASFTGNEVAVGGTVVVEGSLVDYNGTPEMTTGGVVISYDGPQGDTPEPDQPEVPTGESVTFNFADITSLNPAYNPEAEVDGKLVGEYDVTDVTFQAGIITLEGTATEGASNKPRLYKATSGAWTYRFYKDNTITIAVDDSDYVITGIVFNATNLANESVVFTNGTFASNIFTPAGEKGVEYMTVSKNATGNNPTITAITVYYDSKAGVEGITAADENAPVEYFNLQGVRVANPENGLYIRRQGNTATKVLIK